MSYAEVQARLGLWKPNRKRIVDPNTMDKKNLCPNCARENFKVKMDYLGNTRHRSSATLYDVQVYWCPRCNKKDFKYMRIEGRGKSGANMYKVYGGE